MSRITEIVIYAAPDDQDRLEELSFWLRDQAPRSNDRSDGPAGYLLPLDPDSFGGFKNPASRLWAGIANHLDITAFVHHLATLGWGHPESVQALVKDEGDPYFRIYMLQDGKPVQLAPVPTTADLPW